MSEDAFSDRAPSDEDRAFERLLLRSADRDGPTPGAAAAAWTAFAGASSTVALGQAAQGHAALGGAGLGRFGLGRSAEHGLVTKAAVGKALLVGVGMVIGGAVTFAAMGSLDDAASGTTSLADARSGHVSLVAPSGVAEALVVLETAPSSSSDGAASSIVPSQASAERAAIEPNMERHARSGDRATPPKGVASSGSAGTSDPDSTLFREVLALDAIRSSLGRAAFDEALRRVDAFHAEFPNAQLAADAEALGVRALEAKHEDRAARKRAERFLERYPNDPHSGSVQSQSTRPAP